MSKKVIFVPDDYWTDPPEENTMTDHADDQHPANDDVLAYRGQVAAIELCRAVSANDFDTAETLFVNEADAGPWVLRHLMNGLCNVATTLARSFAEQHNDSKVTEETVWGYLAERSVTGLIGSIEIDRMTRGEDDTA